MRLYVDGEKSFDTGPYAVHSFPWTDTEDARIEIVCTRCGTNKNPCIVWQGTQARFGLIISAIARHEPTHNAPDNKKAKPVGR